jgi:mono/diheme cytochrome c family protein
MMRKTLGLLGCTLFLTGAAHAANSPDGKALFSGRCGMCHQTNGMGVGLLARRPGDTSKGLLENRTDLSAAVVKVVVRNGIVNMPRISRGEVSDPELISIADYLSKGKP